MKFLVIVESQPNRPPPTPEKLKAMGAYTEKSIAAGLVLLTGGILRPSKGMTIEQSKGKVTFTDGPFAESKELIDGYAILEARDKEHAMELSKEFMILADCGKAEMLPMYDYGGAPPPK